MVDSADRVAESVRRRVGGSIQGLSGRFGLASRGRARFGDDTNWSHKPCRPIISCSLPDILGSALDTVKPLGSLPLILQPFAIKQLHFVLDW